ncbi:hypothetical protein SAY86_024816 [Trapa natans]|uniref:Uncharacterized protein n=1 Tax=Trapa natans TaxID=22666 RepID=A0AAN7M6D9_TRANT|nr:hypothetical protein SAY86_024816 [Trapa natans]
MGPPCPCAHELDKNHSNTLQSIDGLRIHIVRVDDGGMIYVPAQKTRKGELVGENNPGVGKVLEEKKAENDRKKKDDDEGVFKHECVPLKIQSSALKIVQIKIQSKAGSADE